MKEIKEIVTDFFTMGKHGNKVGFGGTGEIIGGAGRSPPLVQIFYCNYWMLHGYELYLGGFFLHIPFLLPAPP